MRTIEPNAQIFAVTVNGLDYRGEKVVLTVEVEVSELNGRWTAMRRGPGGRTIMCQSRSRRAAILNCATSLNP